MSLAHRLAVLLALLTSSCAIYRGHDPLWVGAQAEVDGSAYHVITGYISDDSSHYDPHVEIRFPADWRTAVRTTDESGAVVAQVDATLASVEGESLGLLAVVSTFRNSAIKVHGTRGDSELPPSPGLPDPNGEIYIVGVTEVSGERQIDVFGFVGWPRKPVRIARFDWAVSEQEALAIAASAREAWQIWAGFAVAVGSLWYLADGGFDDRRERD